jgi:signal transduction histidine kinase
MGTPTRPHMCRTPPAPYRQQGNRFLQAVVDQARLLTGGRAAALCLLDLPTMRVRVTAGSGVLTARIGDEAPALHGLSGRMLASSAAAICLSCDTHCCPFTRAPAVHDHVVAPVSAGNRLRGLLCVISDTVPDAGTDRESLLTHLAALAGSSLVDERVCDLAQDLGALTARRRVAADLHDSLAQSLVSVHMQLDLATDELAQGADSEPRLSRAREMLAGTIDELRATIESLRDPSDRVGRRERMADILGSAARDVDLPDDMISVDVECDLVVKRATASEIRRIVMEALTNARRHAHASRIELRLRREGREAVVSVADDGEGIGEHMGGSGSGAHLGLGIMRLRATMIGGRIEIDTARGHGTAVVLRWPEPAE